MSVNDLYVEKEDRPCYLRFEVRAVKDPEASMKAGHYMSKNEDWALASALGSADVFTQKAEKWFIEQKKLVARGRIPASHYEYYQNVYRRWKEGQEPPVDGTSVKDWNALSPAQCENLINVGLRTIEDVAQAPDEAIRKLGIGGAELKHKAQAWIKSADDQGKLVEEVASLKKTNEQQEGTIKSLQNKIEILETQIRNQASQLKTREYRPAPEEAVRESETVAEQQVREMLALEYEKKFGEKPHHRMKAETIQEKLKESYNG